MAKVENKPKTASIRSFPTKKSLNLATVGIKKINMLVAVPLIALIILGALVIAKFAVVDRYMALGEAQSEEAALQSNVDALTTKLASFGDLEDSYAHYTYSGMTDEELSRSDRIAVLELIDRVVMPKAVVGSITITDNTLTIPVGGATLQEINLIAQELEADDLVSFCTVITANTNDQTDDGTADAVTGMLIAYLNERGQEDEQ